MNIYEEVKLFIKSQNYKGAIGEQGSTAEQNFKRLNEAVNILEQNGITDPTESDFENILRPAIAAKGKKAGEQAQEKTILRTLNLAKRFYQNLKLKGDFQMNENEITITATEERQPEEQTDFYPEALNEGKPEQEKETTKRGKPVTTGRSEKISLYLTPQTFNRLDDLRKYDEANLQDLLNEAIEVYFKTREDDIRFLQEQEEARRARKARKSQEAHND